jgi:mitochondrial chaperone BCS1
MSAVLGDVTQSLNAGSAKLDSAFLNSLILMLVLGTVSSVLYWIYNSAIALFWRSVLVSITVKKPDVAYDWLAAWLAHNRSQILSSTNVSLSVIEKESSGGSYWRRCEEEAVPDEKNMQFLPGEGEHVFKFKGRWVWMSRSTSNPISGGMYNRPIVTETLSVSMIGRNQAPLIELFLEGMKLHRKTEDALTKVYTLEDGYYWRVASQRKPRPIDSVVLDGNIMQSLLADLRLFLASEKDYVNRGLSYQRGYLIYGPPGTGKSSSAAAIAGELGLNICVLNLSNKSLDDEALNSRLVDAPANSILLLEDIDSIFVGRQSASADVDLFRGAGNNGPSISFSGLLNCLDGVASRQGRILFMTTNHPERLDPALIRPGRVDVKVKFDLASASQAENLFKRFYPGEDALAAQVKDVLVSKAVSPAALQGHFLKFPKQPLEALRALPELLSVVDRGEAAHQLIGIWLKRLALPQKYGEPLRAIKILFVSDLKALEPAEVLTVMDVKNDLHKARITKFLSGDEEVKQRFALCKRNAVDLIFNKFCRNATPEQAERFGELLGGDQVSSFELEHYLAQYINEPRKALEHIEDLIEVAAVVDTRSLLKRSAKVLHGPTLEDFLKEAKMSQAVIDKFLEEKMELDQVINNLTENDLSDFGVEKRGDRLRLAAAIEKRKKEIELCL